MRAWKCSIEIVIISPMVKVLLDLMKGLKQSHYSTDWPITLVGSEQTYKV